MSYSNMLAVECGIGYKGRKLQAGTGLSFCNRVDTRKPEKNLKTRRSDDPSSVLSPLSSTCSSNASPATAPARSSIRNIIRSGLRVPSPKISFFHEKQLILRANTQSCSKGHKYTSTNKTKTSLSGSFKGKSVIDVKTKITQTQKKDVCSFEDQVKHFASIALDRDTEVRNRPSYSKRGQLSVEKSLDWDSAFFTNEGLLNTKEMCMINKAFTKSSGTRKDVHVQSESVGSRRLSILRKTVDWDTAFPGEGLLNPQELFMVNEGFKKAESSQSLTTETNSKVQHSNKSSSSGSPKCIRRKINYKNTKPTTCSSDTSPASSSRAVLSPLNYQRPPRHPPCHNSKERKFTSQDATRSSIRNVMPSRLRMPSPRIGFFDEEPRVQLTFKESMQKPNVFPSVERRPSFLHKVHGIVSSSLVQVC